MRKFERKVWGIPGKMKEYYSPSKFMQEKRIVPLNANPLDAWDIKKSRYKRIDLVPREVPEPIQQMDGINESSSTSVPVITPSNTPSITPTPSATPVPLLWNTYNVNWEDVNVNWNNA
jgi:hypothetical protein